MRDPFSGGHLDERRPPEPPRSRAWTVPPQSPEERAAELAAIERQVRRDRVLDLLLAALEGGASLAVGLFLLGWALHTTDETIGGIAFWCGVGIGNAGMLLALVRARARADRRGDF